MSIVEQRTARKAGDVKGAPRLHREPKWDSMIAAIDGTIPVVIRARYASEIEDALKWAEKENLRVILAGAEEAYAVTELLKSKNIPVILDPMFDFPPRRDQPYDRLFSLPRDLNEAGIPRHAKRAVQPSATHVAVDQQHSLAFQRKRRGQVRRGRRLPFLRHGTGHGDALCHAARLSPLQARAQQPECLAAGGRHRNCIGRLAVRWRAVAGGTGSVRHARRRPHAK